MIGGLADLQRFVGGVTTWRAGSIAAMMSGLFVLNASSNLLCLKNNDKKTENLRKQKYFMVFINFHLVPSPVGDTQLYHTLGMGPGDGTFQTLKKHSKTTQKSISGEFVLVL